jgi:hypothetical protein
MKNGILDNFKQANSKQKKNGRMLFLNLRQVSKNFMQSKQQFYAK